MTKTLRVVLADDHEVVRLGLRLLIEQAGGAQVVAEADSGPAAVLACDRHRPDVVILDIRMPPGKSGLEACRQIVATWPETQVIMLTSYADDDLIADAIEAGAVGYLLKAGDPHDLIRALDAVRAGASVLDPAVARRVLALMRERAVHPNNPFAGLTAREFEILRLVADGRNNADIAGALVLSDKTVRNHLSLIFDKLNVANRIEAAAYAVKHGIERHAGQR